MPQLDFGLFPNLIFWLVVALGGALPDPDPGGAAADRHDPRRAQRRDLERPRDRPRSTSGAAQEAETAYTAALAQAREEAQKIAAETKAQIGKELDSLMAKADAEIAARSAESEKRIREIEASAAESVDRGRPRHRRPRSSRPSARAPADDATIAAAVARRLGG